MEPSIRYVASADGVTIAFRTFGQGRPVVYMPAVPFSHIGRAWQVPEVRRGLERRATRCQVVEYDNRGAGSSQRDVRDWSLRAHVRDLEAVTGALELPPFVLWAGGFAGPIAIAFSAAHPERVSHLILWCAVSRGRDLGFISNVVSAVAVSVLSRDWTTFTETGARQGAGWSDDGQLAHRLAEITREALSPKAARRFVGFGGVRRFDATKHLSRIRVPVLVLHRREAPFPREAVAQRLAARIPGAQLRILEGNSLVPQLGDQSSVAQSVNDFSGEEIYPRGDDIGAPAADTRALATVLFTDLVGHTEMMQRLGDERGRAVLRDHERITRDMLQQHGGIEVKTMGDGFMASFASVSGAVECAIALQRMCAERNRSAPEPFYVRVGLNAGEPIREAGDYFGASVILAARIAAMAGAGEILIPEPVRHLLAGKAFLLTDRGEAAIKGFDDAVRLYEVRWQPA